MKRGFTLIEVLISVALAVMMVTMAAVALLQFERLVRRTEARLEMHNAMRYLQATAVEDSAAMIHGCALFLSSPTSFNGTPVPGTSLIFMRGRLHPQDFPTTMAYGAYMDESSDLTWVEWRWDQDRRELLRGENRRSRDFTLDAPWTGRDAGLVTRDFRDRSFYQLPQPWREATGGADAVLNRNAWGTGHADDIGDRQDLEQRLVPIVRNVTACSFELVPDDGTAAMVADGSGPVEQRLDGTYVDGAIPAAGIPPSAKRPVILRMRIQLTDPATGLVQRFAWAFKTPGLLPSLVL